MSRTIRSRAAPPSPFHPPSGGAGPPGRVGPAIGLAGDRSDLREELARTQARLRQTQRRITRLSQSLERAVGRSVAVPGIDTCIDAFDDQVDLFNTLARELNAVRALNESQAESFPSPGLGAPSDRQPVVGQVQGRGSRGVTVSLRPPRGTLPA